MARNSTTVNAPPQIVFDVLADPCAYEHWVVGNKAVRHFDDAWPAPGAEFHHTVGFGPVATKDKTTVVEAEPARRLVLEARAMPVGIARVTLLLEPDGAGTRLTIDEVAEGGPARRVWNPLLDRLTWLRNIESLRRLKRLAEQRAGGARP